MTDLDAGNGANGANGTGGNAAAALNSPPLPPPFWDGFADANLKLAAEKSGLKNAEEVFARANKFDAYKDVDPTQLVHLAPDTKPDAQLKILQERFGSPTEGAAYKLTEIDGVDKPTAEWAQGAFAEAGLTPWQAQMLAAKQMEFVKAGQAQLIAEDKAAAERQDAGLKVEWGTDYTPKMESARRAFKAAGVSAETINYLESGMGYAEVMKLGVFFGKLIKEGTFVEGGKNQAGPTLLERLYPKDVEKDRAARGG